jgi:hypothetical protein
MPVNERYILSAVTRKQLSGSETLAYICKPTP